jgi:hypothetical protein
VRVAVEEHGAGRQYVRVGLRPRVRPEALIVAALCGAACIAASAAAAPVAASVLGLAAAMLVFVAATDCGHAAAIFAAAVAEIGLNGSRR